MALFEIYFSQHRARAKKREWTSRISRAQRRLPIGKNSSTTFESTRRRVRAPCGRHYSRAGTLLQESPRCDSENLRTT